MPRCIGISSWFYCLIFIMPMSFVRRCFQVPDWTYQVCNNLKFLGMAMTKTSKPHCGASNSDLYVSVLQVGIKYNNHFVWRLVHPRIITEERYPRVFLMNNLINYCLMNNLFSTIFTHMLKYTYILFYEIVSSLFVNCLHSILN